MASMGGVPGLRMVAGVAVAALVVAVTVYIARADDPGKAAGFALTLASLVSIAVALTRTVWSRRTPSASRETLASAGDELAAAVRSQWQEEAVVRGLTLPAPVGVRWCWTTRSVALAQDEAGSSLAVGTGPMPVPGVQALHDTTLLTKGTIDKLHDIYAGVSAGRLTIIGGPGAAKPPLASCSRFTRSHIGLSWATPSVPWCPCPSSSRSRVGIPRPTAWLPGRPPGCSTTTRCFEDSEAAGPYAST